MNFKLAITALICAASVTANQGSPGRQGPWPVYLSALPDGGGLGNDPLWVDSGASIKPTGDVPVMLTGGVEGNLDVNSTSGLGFTYNAHTFVDSSGSFGTLYQANGGVDYIDCYAGDHLNGVVKPACDFNLNGSSAELNWDGTKFWLTDVSQGTTAVKDLNLGNLYGAGNVTADGGICFHDHTCQTSAATPGVSIASFSAFIPQGQTAASASQVINGITSLSKASTNQAVTFHDLGGGGGTGNQIYRLYNVGAGTHCDLTIACGAVSNGAQACAVNFNQGQQMVMQLFSLGTCTSSDAVNFYVEY